ncbi:hypothetical protein ACPC54_02025 [Kitasatospora sp. NPDC094028]
MARLAALHREGALDAAEFERAKARLPAGPQGAWAGPATENPVGPRIAELLAAVTEAVGWFGEPHVSVRPVGLDVR